jgi:hypothetical protein
MIKKKKAVKSVSCKSDAKTMRLPETVSEPVIQYDPMKRAAMKKMAPKVRSMAAKKKKK